ncbi:pyrroline-5-carboxylate reductase [Conexibacter sp. SYSU D00693]|uniref:pyrroline-5-carboxylate reductase family protein n=1 Tax=Conexibacter sp. SYSU D00693 TaxID=2812560 RepID=UPI00196B74D6|nr:pyrroline-5-carboxylate reductase dimerization domain-containing protein [Conexibacter sp. SYSU D00693]
MAVRLGLVGAGNMARALARGMGEPVAVFDPFPGRAQELVDELGGEVCASGAEVAQAAPLVLLCHKPPQLGDVAAEVAPHARRVASILGAVPLAALRAAYPDATVTRWLPSTPVEVRQGATILAAESDEDPDARELFDRCGPVFELAEAQVDVAMGLMSNAPAYVALLAEAQVDAGVRRGLPAPLAAELVVQTFAGTAALLRERGFDTLAVRREVTSPGGSTARGLAALERAGVRTAFHDAIDAVLGDR